MIHEAENTYFAKKQIIVNNLMNNFCYHITRVSKRKALINKINPENSSINNLEKI